MKKYTKNQQRAIQYLLKHPDATAYRVAKECGVSGYVARKLIAERQTPVQVFKITSPDYAAVYASKGAEMLDTAVATFKQRAEQYGSCSDTLSDIASIWTGILGQPVSPQEVGLMMIGLKMARLKRNPLHKDSIVDIAGWAAVYAEGVR